MLLFLFMPTYIEAVSCIYGGYNAVFGICQVEMYKGTLEDAKNGCKNINGSLPIITNPEDENLLVSTYQNTFLKFIITSNYNIRSYDSTVWLPYYNGTSTTSIHTDVSFILSRYYQDNPFNPKIPPIYMVYDRFQQKFRSPTKEINPFICYYIPDTRCSGELSKFIYTYMKKTNRCYRSGTDSTFAPALASCTAYNESMAAIQSNVENEIIYSLGKFLYGHTKITDGRSVDFLWLGFNSKLNRWYNGGPLIYSNFVNGSETPEKRQKLTQVLTGAAACNWMYKNTNISSFYICYTCPSDFRFC